MFYELIICTSCLDTFALDVQGVHDVVNLVLLLHSFSVVLKMEIYAKCLNLNVNAPQIMMGKDNGSAKRLK